MVVASGWQQCITDVRAAVLEPTRLARPHSFGSVSVFVWTLHWFRNGDERRSVFESASRCNSLFRGGLSLRQGTPLPGSFRNATRCLQTFHVILAHRFTRGVGWFSCLSCQVVSAIPHTKMHSKGYGEQLPEALWKATTLHSTKASALQTLLGGKISFAAVGEMRTMEGGDPTCAKSLHFEVFDADKCPQNVLLRNHFAFLIQEDRVKDLLEAQVCAGVRLACSMAELTVEEMKSCFEQVSLQQLVSCGEIHIVASCRHRGNAILELPLGSSLSDRLFLIAGPYAGNYLTAMAVLLRHWDCDVTNAMRRLFAAQTCPLRPLVLTQSAPFCFLTTESVQSVLPFRLDAAQTELVAGLLQSPMGNCRPGVVKSTIAAAMFVAAWLALEPDHGCKLYWITPTRSERDRALQEVRAILAHSGRSPFVVAAIGRPAQDCPSEDDDQLLDALTDGALQQQFNAQQAALTQLRSQVANVFGCSQPASAGWQARLALTEKYAVQVANLDAARQSLTVAADHLRRFTHRTLAARQSGIVTRDCVRGTAATVTASAHVVSRLALRDV